MMRHNGIFYSIILGLLLLTAFFGCDMLGGNLSEDVYQDLHTSYTFFDITGENKNVNWFCEIGSSYSSADFPEFSQTGYAFLGYEYDNSLNGTGVPENISVSYQTFRDMSYAQVTGFTATATSATFSAIWYKMTSYTVRHFLQALDGTYGSEPDAIETLYGFDWEQTEASARDYIGFTAQAFSQDAIQPDGSTVIDICYERNIYTVTFDSRGGSSVSSQSVMYGAAVAEPSEPALSGSTFLGWYTSTAFTTKYDFSAPVTGELTLYALWSGGVGGIDIDIPVATDDITVTVTEAGNTITFTAESGCDLYLWYVDEAVVGKAASYTFDKSGRVAGTYDIRLTAKKDSDYYSYYSQITVD